MKKTAFTTLLIIFGLVLFSGCVSMHAWPDYERSAESKMVGIEERIGEGLKTGALTPDQAQMFLTTLKGIRTDYTALRNQIVYQEKWNSLHDRLDVLGDEINRAFARTTQMEAPMNMERIPLLQRTIDDGRISGRLPLSEEKEFQTRLDSIRSDYVRMTEDGRTARYEEREDISRRLDFLARDLDRFRL